MILKQDASQVLGFFKDIPLQLLFKKCSELSKVFNGVPFHRQPLINRHLYNPEQSDKALS